MAENEFKYKKFQKVRTANDKPTTSVVLNKYIVTIGFEVNYPDAFVERDNGWVSKSNERTQLLDIDYGHAFFYVTKNDIVEVFFSFGRLCCINIQKLSSPQSIQI
ncbi:hypothetical protein [Acinetobacter seifertii]|uniref:hypothetical protein n=1 Tax=Acinetobacter seifertii TaxID=1530123 RepID=UPI0032B434A5